LINKFQIISGLMALVAVSLVYFGFKNLKLELELKPSQANITAPLESDADWDDDGLNNREESYWNTDPNNSDTDDDGYLDGEEVASGHDPTKPGPDDEIFSDNLTERLSSLALSGIIEGSLKPDNPNFVDSVNLVIDDILLQSDLKLLAKPRELKIVEDTPENIKRYAVDVLPFVRSMVQDEGKRIERLFSIIKTVEFFDNDKLAENNAEYTNLLQFLDAELPKMRRQIDFLQTSEVPDRMKDSHLAVLGFIKELTSNYASLRNARQDPIQAMISLNNIIKMLMDDLLELLTSYY